MKQDKKKYFKLFNLSQVTLEMAVAMILLLLFLVGTIKIYAWIGRRFVWRDSTYKAGRVQAGSFYANTEAYYKDDDSERENLEVFSSSAPQ